jgi:hypothetical protein
MLKTPFQMRTLRTVEPRQFPKTLTRGQTYAHATIVIQSSKHIREALYASSEEFVRDKYAVQAIPIVDTKGYKAGQHIEEYGSVQHKTYDLELDGHDSEVENLHAWPHHKVGLESWNIDVLKLPSNCALATTFGNCHECEKCC